MALLLSRSATKALLGMPKKERQQFRDGLVAVAAAPHEPHPSVTAMQGAPAGRFRVRQGDWRAVFRIDGDDVLVNAIGHRRETYD